MATGCFSFAFRRMPSFLSPADHGGEGEDPDDEGSPLARLFRSKSELNVKKNRRGSGGGVAGGYWSKPSLSEADVRRMADRQRYRRVVRDVGSPDEAPSGGGGGGGGGNPHVVHRFTKKYLQKHNIDKSSSSSSSSSSSAEHSESCTEEGSKNWRKHQQDQEDRRGGGGARPILSKTTISFENEVEVFEYDRLEKVEAEQPLCTHKVQLTTGDDATIDEEEEEEEEGDDGRSDRENENPRMLISSRVEDIDLCYDYV